MSCLKDVRRLELRRLQASGSTSTADFLSRRLLTHDSGGQKVIMDESLGVEHPSKSRGRLVDKSFVVALET